MRATAPATPRADFAAADALRVSATSTSSIGGAEYDSLGFPIPDWLSPRCVPLGNSAASSEQTTRFRRFANRTRGSEKSEPSFFSSRRPRLDGPSVRLRPDPSSRLFRLSDTRRSASRSPPRARSSSPRSRRTGCVLRPPSPRPRGNTLESSPLPQVSIPNPTDAFSNLETPRHRQAAAPESRAPGGDARETAHRSVFRFQRDIRGVFLRRHR